MGDLYRPVDALAHRSRRDGLILRRRRTNDFPAGFCRAPGWESSLHWRGLMSVPRIMQPQDRPVPSDGSPGKGRRPMMNTE